MNLSNPWGSSWYKNGRDLAVCYGWVDENQTGRLGAGDVLYMVENMVNRDPNTGTIRTWFVQSFNPGSTVTVTLWRGQYTFHIRTNTVFVNTTQGSSVGHSNVVDTLETQDVVYSFRRALVEDYYQTWPLYKSFFDQFDSNFWNKSYVGPGDPWTLTRLINNTIETSGSDVILNVGIPLQDTTFKQILCKPYSSIISREHSIDIGCWNDANLFTGGNLPDWWMNWRHNWLNGIDSPYETAENAAGTGAFRLITFDKPNAETVLVYNELYWRGWPAPNRQSHLNVVVINYLPDLDSILTRMQGPNGHLLDLFDVPRFDSFLLLDGTTYEPTDNWKETIKQINPFLSMEAMHFTFVVNPQSRYIGTGTLSGGPNGGIPPDFFNNTYVRKAFAYAWNHTQYLSSVWGLGMPGPSAEAFCRETPLMFGMTPDYYTKQPDYNNPTPQYTYDSNLAQTEQMLKNAKFMVGGQLKSVWETGFHFQYEYNYLASFEYPDPPDRPSDIDVVLEGNGLPPLLSLVCGSVASASSLENDYPVYVAGQIIQDFFARLSTYDGRTSDPNKAFNVELCGTPWSDFMLGVFYEHTIPLWTLTYQADMSDPDFIVRACMYSDLGAGNIAYFQNYTLNNGWATPGPRTGLNKDRLIDLALTSSDVNQKKQYYADLEDIYLQDVPSFPIAQPKERKWMLYTVKGWYYNAMYSARCSSSELYYYLYKAENCWCDVSGTTPGVPDGITNMRDLSYVLNRFNARAPLPNYPYDPKWAPGTYGCGGCDVYGDRVVNMRDNQKVILHFNHRTGP